MKLRRFCTLLGISVLATTTAAEAKVHHVSAGDSIQAAVDAASPGDTILVESAPRPIGPFETIATLHAVPKCAAVCNTYYASWTAGDDGPR